MSLYTDRITVVYGKMLVLLRHAEDLGRDDDAVAILDCLGALRPLVSQEEVSTTP